MTGSRPTVFVFSALACEAKTLIKAWHLPRLPSADHPFAIYADENRVIVITGMGKTNMAGAIGYAMALFNSSHYAPILINLGIAGHPSETVGTLCLGHKIIDIESGRCFYPQMPFAASCTSHSVQTGSRPNTGYAENLLSDMEAAGFYEMAVKFSSSELIQVMKIVSDNAQSTISHINETLTEEWIERQLPTIDQIVTRLIGLRETNQVETSPVYQELIDNFHFTLSRSLKLKALLRRWQLLKGNEIITWRETKSRNAKELLIWIEKQLDNTNFYL